MTAPPRTSLPASAGAGMFALLARAALDLADGRRLGGALALPSGSPSEIVLSGMGGSAIAGDLAAATLAGRLPAGVAFRVCRHYAIDPPPRPGALVILSSYSGDTEETLAAADALHGEVAPPLAIASGGRLLERARAARWPRVELPGGLPPRASLYLTWAALLAALARAGSAPDLGEDLREAERVAETTARANAPGAPGAEREALPARALARHLAGRLPVLIATGAGTAAAALRWKGEMNENAKVPALSAVLPEMHHNEIVGLTHAPGPAPLAAIVLRDAEEHARVARRAELTRMLLAEAGVPVVEVSGEGGSRLARLVSLTLLGDHASTYLALDRGVDPTPVHVIDRIKAALAADALASARKETS